MLARQPIRSYKLNELEKRIMKRKMLLVVVALTALVLAACGAPSSAPTTASQPVAGQGRPEMTVFRSPT